MANFHGTPFDEGTATKLALFSAYAREWLPVFLSPKFRGAKVTIVDFFAGPGRDIHRVEGSPLRILRTIREYTTNIRQNQIQVRLELNEAAPQKAATLRQVMEGQNVPTELCRWQVHSESFEVAFDKLRPALSGGPNLVLLDQQGIKFISDDVFQELITFQRTDFMFFIASSFIKRFWDHPYFRRHLTIPGELVTGTQFSQIHRIVTDYYRNLVPYENEFFLAPFSIKKGSNIYGIVFGSAHSLGIAKFLRVCWEIDPERGEANFDIDGDAIDRMAPFLFDEFNVSSKLSAFHASLNDKVRSGALRTDGDVYLECLREGMLPKHGRELLRRMIRDKEVRTCCGRKIRVSEEGRRAPRVLEVIGNVPI